MGWCAGRRPQDMSSPQLRLRGHLQGRPRGGLRLWMKGEKGHFSMKQAGVVGPGHLGCRVQRVGHDCRTERWGDSGILMGIGPGDSDAEATSLPGGGWTGVSGAGNGPHPMGHPPMMS